MGSLVKVMDRKVPTRFFRGKPVVTLPQVDEFHGRPKNTAARNFSHNRKHFVEGEDFFEATYEEWNQLFGTTNFVAPKKAKGGHRGSMILLTLTGYMMLVKSLNDEKAWQIHRALVNAYFAKKQPNRQTNPAEIEAINIDVLLIGTSGTARKYGRSETFIKDHTKDTRAAAKLGQMSLFA